MTENKAPEHNQYHSTIAQVISGREDGGGRRRSRQAALAEKILEVVHESPGVTANEIGKQIGEKAIFVLSLADELLRKGRLISPDRDGKLYPAPEGDSPAESATDGSPEEVRASGEGAAESETENPATFCLPHAFLFIGLFRVLHSLDGLVVRAGLPLVALAGEEKFLEAFAREGRLQIALFGQFSDKAVVELTRFKDTKANPVRVLKDAGIIDIRCSELAEVEALRSGLAACLREVGQGGRERPKGTARKSA